MRKTAAEEMERRSSWDESLARVASFMDAPVFAPPTPVIGSQFYALASRKAG
jgi:hypothetical protein